MEELSSSTTRSSRPLTVLIIDDDRAVRGACESAALEMGFYVLSASSVREGLSTIEQKAVDIVIADPRTGRAGGLGFLHEIRKSHHELPVIITSGDHSVELAVEVMQNGAYTYLCKPFGMGDLHINLQRIRTRIIARDQVEDPRMDREDVALFGRSPELNQLFKAVARTTNWSTPVLIEGEQGTGKEILARAIHLATKTSAAPFVPVDCLSLSPELLEHELFGHVKGAFPGAATNRPGLLASAEAGTVLLSDISGLPLSTQAKLVRAIQRRTIRPFGSTKAVPIRSRLIATNRSNLSSLVSAGGFRQDLYYLLNVLVVRLRPLRERIDEIPLLVRHFVARMHQEHADSFSKKLSPAALKLLAAHDWPGNLQELESVLARAFILCQGDVIDVAHLPSEIQKSPVSKALPAKPSLAEMERAIVMNALAETKGDKQKAARLLGVSRTTLYRKLYEYSVSS